MNPPIPTMPGSNIACARPGCPRPAAPRQSRGRPPIYCTPACRAAAQRRPDAGPILVEIDHTSPEPGRPSGRVWLVRLRRGQHTVTIATNLGRPTANTLAHQIAQLLRTRTHQGGHTD